MTWSVRSVVMTAVPTMAFLLGVVWFRRKKKPADSPQHEAMAAENDQSIPKVTLTQPSAEGKTVIELVEGKPVEMKTSKYPEEDSNLPQDVPEVQEDVLSSTAATLTASMQLNDEVTTFPHMGDGSFTDETEYSVGDNTRDSESTEQPNSLVATDHVEEVIQENESDTLSLGKATHRETVHSESETPVSDNSRNDSFISLPTETGDVVSNSNGQASQRSSESENASQSTKGHASQRSSESESGSHRVDSTSFCMSDSSNEIATSSNNISSDLSVRTDSESCPDVEQAVATVSSQENNAQKEGDKGSNSSENQSSESNSAKKWGQESWSTTDSPSVSPLANGVASTNGSEASIDSGIEATSASVSDSVGYQFQFPTELCGLLIGSRGKHIKRLMEQTKVNIVVKKKEFDPSHQLIMVEGTKSGVDKTIDILKRKFPLRRYPDVDFSSIAPLEHAVLLPEIMQIGLPDGVGVEVIVSSVVSANHLFIQQPTHPTFFMLTEQNKYMNLCYGQDTVIPQLPRPVEESVICAAPMCQAWYRAQIVRSYPETDEVDLRFVDYGGYCHQSVNTLRQIRSDFTTLPFQAVECYLANVIPPSEMSSFPPEANAVLEQIVHQQMSQAEVVGYEEDGVPYINLYVYRNNKLSLVNRELVEQGVATWIEAY